jgi:3-phosphoshikimate 1-carboxyvinyltransferase
MGADLNIQEDYLVIRGGKPLKAATVKSHNDHRIAMMCAVAALKADGDVIIAGAEAVDKSYPRFFEDLQSVGGKVLISG